MNSNDFFYLRICFNTGISLWICIVHNCLRNKSTRNASHYFMQILIYCVKQKLTVILLMELWYYIPAVPPMLSVIHFFSITGKHAMLLSCFVFFVGLEEEILQYGGGHERKDPSILQSASTQLHGNWQGINLRFIIKCLYFINPNCIWILDIPIVNLIICSGVFSLS